MFRGVDLPPTVRGRLLLHSLPGRYEALERVWHQVKTDAVGVIVCLTERDETHVKSQEYLQAMDNGSIPCLLLQFGIPDRGAPEDRDGFWNLACDIATRLQSGQTVLIHCAGGVGRTAMLSICVLLALGQAVGDAREVVSRAGSTVETAPQSNLISWCAARASGAALT